MRIKNGTLNLLYITAFVIISGYGLILALGINEGRFLILPLSYSNLSNIVCFGYFFICLLHGIVIQFFKEDDTEISFMPRLKGTVTMCVTVTLLIFHFLLSRGTVYIPGTSTIDWRNLIIHYLTPLLAITHWLLFDKKGTCKANDPIIWITIPISYLFFSLMCTDDTIRYTYYFINPSVVGWSGVFSSVIALVTLFILLGYFVCILDRYLEKLGKEKNIT